MPDHFEEIAQRIIEKKGVEFSQLLSKYSHTLSRDDFTSLLHMNATVGGAAICRDLLTRMTDASGARGANKYTALHYAAANGHLDICTILTERSDLLVINAIDAKMRIPLHLAAEQGHTEICNFLITRNKEGSQVNSRDINASSPLNYAAANGHYNTCELLLRNGAEVNSEDKNFRTPLILAAGSSKNKKVLPKLCELFLDRGANIHHQDLEKRTVLQVAKAAGNTELCEMLIRRGAKTDEVQAAADGLESDNGTEPKTCTSSATASNAAQSSAVKSHNKSSNQL